MPGRKAGNSTGYPLAGPVAEALADYIRNDRPATSDRRVFFRAVAPRVPIGRAAVTHTVQRCLSQAGVRAHRPGAHTLRHSCVQASVDAGFAFKAVADYVGHRSTGLDGRLREDRSCRVARSRLRRRGGPVTAPAMRSALAEPLRRFVQHKRALNRKYRSEEASLRLFDSYLAARGTAGFEDVDSALIDCFLQSRPRSARSHNHLLGVLRVFFAWAVLQRLTVAHPVTARPRPVTASRLPFLFDLGTSAYSLPPASCRTGAARVGGPWCTRRLSP